MINLETIPENEQANMIASFWTMLQNVEGNAIDQNCPLTKHWVKQWYEQWNRVTGDNKKPRWERT